MKLLSLWLFLLTLVISCWPHKKSKVESISTGALAEEQVPFLTLEEYVSSCESWLGPLPELIDCSEGGKNEELQFNLVAHVDLEDIASRKVCSNPSFGSLFDQACAGTSRFYREENANGTLSIAICRRLMQGTKLNFLSAMISHNSQSGGTCFFLYKKETPFVENGLLPGPGYKGDEELKIVENNWRSPTYMTRDKLGTCVECHSSAPWIRAPAVISPRERQGGEPLVPRGAQMHDYLSNYWVVERKRLSQISLSDHGEAAGWRWTPMALDDSLFKKDRSQAPYCMKCHLIGAGQFIRLLAPSAAGFRFDPSPTRFPKDDPIARFNTHNLDWRALAWHSSFLKGGVPQKGDSEQSFNRKVRPSMLLFDACAQDPSRCAWKTFSEMVRNSSGEVVQQMPEVLAPYDQSQYDQALLNQVFVQP